MVFDLDGVVYVERRGVPGAGDALGALTAAGIRVLFATNNATKTRRTVAEQIHTATGFACNEDQVVTSAWVTASAIGDRHRTAFVVGEQGLVDTLAAAGISVTESWRDADAVVVGLDRNVTYDRLAAATLAIGRGAEFVATNTDATFPTDQGPVPGGGAIVAAIETASGVAPVVYGKPHEPFRAALRILTVGQVMMVGDRPETDIALGRAEEWSTALVLTGVVTATDSVPQEHRPDHVVASIAEVPALLGITG